MYCPHCGKQVNREDNFCRFCGTKLEEEVDTIITKQPEISNTTPDKHLENFVYEGEELVLYEIQKHWMSLFWPVFLTPLFFIYFWIIFLNTHSLFSWIVVIALLALIIYPISRYKTDSIIITTKSAHIKIGVINPATIEIPLDKLNVIDVSQSSLGRIFDYGTATFCINAEKYDYPYIKYPEDLQFIIDEPQKFIEESLRENP